MERMASALPNFPAFNVNDSAVDVRWRKWTNRFENLLIGMDIKDKKRQRALLLHYAGEEVNEIFETLTNTGDDYAGAKGKLDTYLPSKRIPSSRYTSFDRRNNNRVKESTRISLD